MDTHTCLKRARLKTDPIVDTIQTPVEDLLIDKLCTFLMKPFDYSKEQAPIVTAVLLERMDDLHRLVKEGADIDAQDELGRSALIMAIEPNALLQATGLPWSHRSRSSLVRNGLAANVMHCVPWESRRDQLSK